jgi:hypothetical protein
MKSLLFSKLLALTASNASKFFLPISLILKNHPSHHATPLLPKTKEEKTRKHTLHIALRHSFRFLSFSAASTPQTPPYLTTSLAS